MADRPLTLTVELNSDDLRAWAERHADAGHHGVAHVLYKAAEGVESITEQHDREVRADERARIVARLNADIDDIESHTEDHPATSGILRAVGLITLVDRSEKKAEKKRARRTGRTYREVRAEAWDEGYEAGTINTHEHRPGRRMTNPYREGGAP